MKFRFLEHTADTYIEAYGENLQEALENAALAMFEVMTDTRMVKPRLHEEVKIEAKDREELLYRWLEQLIVRFETKNRLYSRFAIESIRSSKGAIHLKADVWGEAYDKDRHPSRVTVKSVTYHRMEILEREEIVTLRFILDI